MARQAPVTGGKFLREDGLQMQIFQPGDLPAVGTGAFGSGSRGIDRTERSRFDKGSFVVHSARQKSPFLFRLSFLCFLSDTAITHDI